MTEIPLNPDKITRRKFGKLIAASIAAPLAAAGAHEAVHEINLAEKGMFETAEANWYPIYEIHPQHEQVLIPANIPSSLSALALEGSSNTQTFEEGKTKDHNDLQAPINSLLGSNTEGRDTFPPTVQLRIPIETLDHLKKHHIPVAYGDIAYDKDDLESRLKVIETLEMREKMGEEILKGGAVVTAVGQGLKTAKIDRRGFLRTGGLATILAGAGKYLPAHYRQELHQRLMEAVKSGGPDQRLWARLQTVSSDLMPEFLNDLFRELIQANKLILLAKSLKSTRLGEKPSIAYNWHLTHRGIEDWLRLGSDVIRTCILAYPDEILKQILEANNNDPRSLYAIRLVQVPNSFKILSSDDTGTITTYDPNEVIEDNVFPDDILLLFF